jgi:hypothetical protein
MVHPSVARALLFSFFILTAGGFAIACLII